MDLTLLFAGAAVSILVQLLKEYFGTNRTLTLAAVVVLSIIGGAGSWYLQHAGLWDSFLQIVVAAGAVYAFIVKNLEDTLLVG